MPGEGGSLVIVVGRAGIGEQVPGSGVPEELHRGAGAGDCLFPRGDVSRGLVFVRVGDVQLDGQAGADCRLAASQARASMDKVIWAYQARQERT